MNVERIKLNVKIITNFMLYCRFNHKREYTDEQLFRAMESIPDDIMCLQKEIENKDKIIHEMAKWIFDKDYTENSLLIHRDDYYSNCIKQVTQYFEKKVNSNE